MLEMAEEKAFYLHVVPLSTIGEAEGGGGRWYVLDHDDYDFDC